MYVDKTQLAFKTHSSGGLTTMNRTGIAIAVGALFCLSAAVQAQTGAQAGAQSHSQTLVQSGQTQAQPPGNALESTSGSAQNRQANACPAGHTALHSAPMSPIH